MRRLVGIVMVGLLFAACTPESSEPPDDAMASAEPTIAEPITGSSASPSPELTLEPTESCEGLGHASSRGEITFINGDRLIAASTNGARQRCLAELDDIEFTGVDRLEWNASGDRVLIGGRALSGDLAATRRLAPGMDPTWSRPTGTSVIWIEDGRLMKRSSLGGKATEISFLPRHDAATYHPSGTHIAASGKASDGSYGLYIATNLGTEPKLIARGEAANFISNLRFSEDGRFLHYEARHGPENWHLHRLSMGKDPFLETLAKGRGRYEYVVSPFNPYEVAWFEMGDCDAGEAGSFSREYDRPLEIPDAFGGQNIHPVGWVSAGNGLKLVIRVASTGCSAQPGDVYVISERNAPVLIDEDNLGSVSIRSKMPPPPPPPGEEQEVVA